MEPSANRKSRWDSPQRSITARHSEWVSSLKLQLQVWEWSQILLSWDVCWCQHELHRRLQRFSRDPQNCWVCGQTPTTNRHWLDPRVSSPSETKSHSRKTRRLLREEKCQTTKTETQSPRGVDCCLQTSKATHQLSCRIPRMSENLRLRSSKMKSCNITKMTWHTSKMKFVVYRLQKERNCSCACWWSQLRYTQRTKSALQCALRRKQFVLCLEIKGLLRIRSPKGVEKKCKYVNSAKSKVHHLSFSRVFNNVKLSQVLRHWSMYWLYAHMCFFMNFPRRIFWNFQWGKKSATWHHQVE